MEAAKTAKRSRTGARAHALFRLLVVVLALSAFGHASYHVTLATEQLFRIFGGALR